MLTPRTLCSAVALAGVLAAFQIPTLAQSRPNPSLCPRGAFENESDWIRRCQEEEDKQYKDDAQRQSRAMNDRIRETQRQRVALEKQPPLPLSQNRLIGRWQTSTPRPAASADPFSQIGAMLSGCGVLIGDGILEFQPNRMAMIESTGRTDMGAVEYRGGANGAVFVLPAPASPINLLPFEFETPDRIHLVGVVCTLVRTNAGGPATGRATTPAPATGRATASTSPPAGGAGAKPSAAAAAPPASASPAAAPRSGLLMARDKVGYDCPDGAGLAISSCFNETDDADCLVIRVDLPPKNGFEVTFIEKRGVLVKRASSCKQRRLMRDANNRLTFEP